jgi:tetratricopeptide (TPR) repeat protein
MEARPIVELSRFIKNPVVPVLTLLLAAVPMQYVSAQAAADNAALGAAFNQGLEAYRKADYQKAVDQFGIILASTKEKTPESVLYCLGFSHYNLGQYEDASKLFRQYVEHFPADEKAPEVQLFLGKSLLQIEGDGNAEEALKFIAAAATKSPDLLEAARFAAADAYIKKKDTAKAAEVLKSAINEKISGPMLMKVSLQLVDLYIENDQLSEAGALLRKVEESASYADVIVAVNHRLVELGDKHLEAQHYSDALEAYSSARPRAQVIALQTARLEYMKTRLGNLTKNLQARVAKKETIPHQLEEQAATLKAMIDNVDQVLTQVKGLDQYDAILEYRIARCYFNMNRFWPATAAFEAVVSDFPTFPDAPTALYGATICQWRLNRKDATRALATRYLDANPSGKYVAQLSEINGVTLLQQGMNEEAITFLTTYLTTFPKTDNLESFRGLLANAKFSDGKYDAAAEDYDKLRTEFPNSKNFEEYTYRRALCDFLRNRYDDTIKSFEAYEKAFPKGQFLAEVSYRRGIILLAKAAAADTPEKKAAYYKELISSMETTLKDPAAERLQLLGPIYTLMGDAYSAMGDKDSTTLAATSYASAVKNANGDLSVISYALDEATKMLRGARRYDDLTDLWQTFLKNNPGHPMELRGVSELSKLLVRSGKIDEARKLLVSQILGKIDNPRSEYVEMLLSQLADLFVPKRVAVKKGETPPPPPAVSPEEELVKALDIPEDQRTPAYVARVLFAKSELARKLKDTDKAKLQLKVLSGTAKPEDMSPVLLKIVGDYLFSAGSYDEAIPFYVRLRDAFPQSTYAEAAPTGLGRIALAKKDYAGAIGFFDAAMQAPNVSSATQKEATFGKAVALFNQKKTADAKKLFEEIVGEKDWRGVEKAGSLFYLGEIADSEGNPGDANGLYQRVYLSQGAFLEYVAKAYLRSSDMFQKKADTEGYKNTLRAMIANQKLASFPETKEAQKRLQSLGE